MNVHALKYQLRGVQSDGLRIFQIFPSLTLPLLTQAKLAAALNIGEHPYIYIFSNQALACRGSHGLKAGEGDALAGALFSKQDVLPAVEI